MRLRIDNLLKVCEFVLPALHHLAEVERLLRERRPAPLKGYLEESTAETSRRLLDVGHVRDQGIPLKLELADVRLKESVHLKEALQYSSQMIYRYS